jgi:surfactin synthase thioesterase subunit
MSSGSAGPEAGVRLICLPHAGGSAGFYRWLADLGPGIEVLIARYPGREGRLAEPMPPSWPGCATSVPPTPRCGVPLNLVEGWADVTSGAFAMQTFPGGHFFLLDQAPAVCEAVAQATRSSRK